VRAGEVIRGGTTGMTGATGREGVTSKGDGFAGVGRTSGAIGFADEMRAAGAGEGDARKSGFGAAGFEGVTEITDV
jgi:hypothetical protein